MFYVRIFYGLRCGIGLGALDTTLHPLFNVKKLKYYAVLLLCLLLLLLVLIVRDTLLLFDILLSLNY